MKLLKYLFPILSLSFALSVSATTTTTWVRTTGLSYPTSGGITINGLTSSTTDANATTTVYFEYGTNISNLASTTPASDIPSLSLDSNKNSVFSANITNTIASVWNYFRAVRKIVYTGNSNPEYVRGQIYQTTPPLENKAPEILAVVPYVGSACTSNSCSISIPENFSVNSVVATIYTRDLNSNQSHSLSIKNGNTDDAFYINGFGQLKVNNKSLIDYETITSFNLTIEVKDNGTPQKTDTVSLAITITNVNNEPVSDATYVTNNVNSTYVAIGSVGGNNTVSYVTPRNTSTYYDPSGVVNHDVNYISYSSGGSTYNTASSGNNSSVNYVTVGTAGSTYGPNGGTVTVNTNYNNNSQGGSTYQNLSNQERQEILDLLVALKIEIDRRIRLGIK